MLKREDLRGRAADGARALARGPQSEGAPVEAVRSILADVRARGDEALRELTERFDGVRIGELAVPPREFAAALERLEPDLRESLVAAHGAIEAFHRERPSPLAAFRHDGIAVEHLLIPVERVGCYVPGGRARYPSSLLMTAVPARVAGVDSVVCCVPPGPDGSVPDEVLAAAGLAGVDELYRVGGAQAIGALAYGTATIRPVDVVVGPGNRYVACAQSEVRGLVGVPAAYAGPSEVVVVVDESVPPDWAAIDLLVQAEHGPDGRSWCITWSERVADAVDASLERLLAASPRPAEAAATFAAGGGILLVDGPEEAVAAANGLAPEHLELLCAEARALASGVRHAGVVFCGPLAAAAIGDYLAGPSHVLPTATTSRFASVLGVEDFLRRVHVVEVSPEGLAFAARHAARIASAEGLEAHAESLLLRDGRPTWSAP